MRIRTLMVGLVLTAFASAAHAQPVLFDVDGTGSSIDYSSVFGGCGSFLNPGPCISADLASGLGSATFNLNAVGDSHTFDFAEITFADSIGAEVGDLEATVAFDSPTGAVANTFGEAGVANLFGVVELGNLVWLPIPNIEMPNGIAFGLELQELAGINFGSTVTVGATVTLLAMAVPEPLSLGLMAIGLLALGVVRRRRV